MFLRGYEKLEVFYLFNRNGNLFNNMLAKLLNIEMVMDSFKMY
jgi:hypothetical protein